MTKLADILKRNAATKKPSMSRKPWAKGRTVPARSPGSGKFKSKSKKGYRYGMPEARAAEMDRVYNGALDVIKASKARGEFMEVDAKKAKQAEIRFKQRTNKAVALRTAKLEKRLKVSIPKPSFGAPKSGKPTFTRRQP